MSLTLAFFCMFLIGLLSGVILTVYVAVSLQAREDEKLDSAMRDAVRDERAKESKSTFKPDILYYDQ